MRYALGMIILGIDPGTTLIGFGFIKYENDKFEVIDYGCIETTPKTSIPHKIKEMNQDLGELLKQHKPDQVAIEELFFAKNVKTGIQVAECRGAIIYELVRNGYDINEYKPMEIKTNVTGFGGSDKGNMQKMVQLLLNLPSIPKPDDAADALAIAICHANHLKHKQLND